MSRFALFENYPFLEGKIPRTALGHWPTPLEPLEKVAAQLGTELLLIKRDDLSHPDYGGNKPRKLEFIFAEALRKGYREVITSGGLGSHHMLAVAALGREVGLHTIGLFFCQPVNDHVRTNLLLEQSFGTEMHFVKDYPGVARGYISFYLHRLLRDRRPPMVIMPGGSTVVSTLGYINAALELKAQLAEQNMADPEAIFVAAGTGGTAAGLLAGLALGGMETRLHAVRVVHPALLKSKKIISLARKALLYLAALGVNTDDARQRLPMMFQFEEEYLGEGYGFSTPEGGAAIKTLQDDGIILEGCYTGKAAAAFIDYCISRRHDSSRPVILLNTASSTHGKHIPAPSETAAKVAALPPSFRWCFESAPRRCQCSLQKQNHRFCESVWNGKGGF